MSKSCQLNFTENTIDVAKAFMKKASIYGIQHHLFQTVTLMAHVFIIF